MGGAYGRGHVVGITESEPLSRLLGSLPGHAALCCSSSAALAMPQLLPPPARPPQGPPSGRASRSFTLSMPSAQLLLGAHRGTEECDKGSTAQGHTGNAQGSRCMVRNATSNGSGAIHLPSRRKSHDSAQQKERSGRGGVCERAAP